jgi:hypothetical protein
VNTVKSRMPKVILTRSLSVNTDRLDAVEEAEAVAETNRHQEVIEAVIGMVIEALFELSKTSKA